jgi:hypothetical protein
LRGFTKECLRRWNGYLNSGGRLSLPESRMAKEVYGPTNTSQSSSGNQQVVSMGVNPIGTRSAKAPQRAPLKTGDRVRKRGYLFGGTVAGWCKVVWDDGPARDRPGYCDPMELELDR